MKKIILIFLFLSTFAQADYLLGHLERCASDYYYSYSGSTYNLYYKDSYTNNWISTSSDIGFIQDGYVWDNDTQTCYKDPTLAALGVEQNQFNFLVGIVGLIFGFTLIQLFFIMPLRNA